LISEIDHSGKIYTVNLESGIDLSIQNNFSGDAPTFFNSNPPTIRPAQSKNFIGDIGQGGSCNVPITMLNIHCTGTHTESIGHINDSGVRVVDVCPKGLMTALLITVIPRKINETNDSYHSKLSNELVITRESIQKQLTANVEGLILRTLPNNQSKKSRDYDAEPAPFFTNDAIDYIHDAGIKHLLVDIPSVDKADDGGMLENHRRFFKNGATISELLFIPDITPDGFGFLQIQIPNWGLDVVPSRPIFYPV